ncbi:SGNH/GDSL hydrolase family protein [bacterium]|nr:SGNH/GDSL hydrolase family protein [bacterium]
MRRFRPVLFVALGLLLSLAIVEAGVRVLVAVRTGSRALTYGFRADRDFRLSVNRHDETLSGYSKYRPHQKLVDHDAVTGERFTTQVNASGFRGADFGPKPPGALRVVALGASSTFGFHDRDGETWPALLAAALARLCPDRSWQVLNLGIPHLMSDEILALFRTEGLALAPDVVVFYEGVNDSSARRKRQAMRRRLHAVAIVRTMYRTARERLLLVRFLDEAIRRPAQTFDRDEVAAHLHGRGDEFLASLEAIREECRRQGIVFVVVTQQAKSYLVPDDGIAGVTYAEEEARVRAKLEAEGRLRPTELWFLAHAEITRRERAWAAERGVVLVDGIAALDGHRDVLVSWVHLTPEGNERLAAAIAPVITERFCGSGPSQTPGGDGG